MDFNQSSEIRFNSNLTLYYLQSQNYQPITLVQKMLADDLVHNLTNNTGGEKKTLLLNKNELAQFENCSGNLVRLELVGEGTLTIHSDLILILDAQNVLLWNHISEQFLSKLSVSDDSVKFLLTYYEKPVIQLKFKLI